MGVAGRAGLQLRPRLPILLSLVYVHQRWLISAKTHEQMKPGLSPGRLCTVGVSRGGGCCVRTAGQSGSCLTELHSRQQKCRQRESVPTTQPHTSLPAVPFQAPSFLPCTVRLVSAYGVPAAGLGHSRE